MFWIGRTIQKKAFTKCLIEFAISRYSDVKWPKGGATCDDRGPGCAQGLLLVSPDPGVRSPAALAPRWTSAPRHPAAWLRKQGGRL